jgi:hypothetical protein
MVTTPELVGPNGLLGGLTRSAMRLDPADIDAIAERVVLLMTDHQPAPAARLVDAAELASIFHVDRSWVYTHANELHAVRQRATRRPPRRRPRTAAVRPSSRVPLT